MSATEWSACQPKARAASTLSGRSSTEMTSFRPTARDRWDSINWRALPKASGSGFLNPRSAEFTDDPAQVEHDDSSHAWTSWPGRALVVGVEFGVQQVQVSGDDHMRGDRVFHQPRTTVGGEFSCAPAQAGNP